jgi:hypothetical protein
MSKKIFCITIQTTMVVSASSEAEAINVARLHGFVPGATQVFSKPMRLTSIDQLPKGWSCSDKAFSSAGLGQEPGRATHTTHEIQYFLNKPSSASTYSDILSNGGLDPRN